MWRTLCPVVLFSSFVVLLAAQDWGCCMWNTAKYFRTATIQNVKGCLQEGANVVATRDDGHTPLHFAAQHSKDPAVVQALLAHGANLNAKTKTDAGYTPLHAAAAFNPNLEVLQALLAAGADPNVRDDANQTPLERAASNENSMVVQALLAAGAVPEARNQDDGSSLQPAARNIPSAARFPFIQTFLRLDTTEKKLEHLRSWHPGMAKEHGISEDEGYLFDSLLSLFVFYHVDDKGVLDCEAAGENLLTGMGDRYEITNDSYVMFNTAVDELCPKFWLYPGNRGRAGWPWSRHSPGPGRRM